MLITIIIATRNAAATLPRCLDSIRAQTWRDFEVLVMDGGSTDGTVEVLRGGADIVTLWRSAPDKGVFDAWNKALAHARGEWICFLGADDRLWDPGALERLVPYVRQAMPEFRVVYSKMRQVDAMDHVLQELGRPWPEARRMFRRYAAGVPHPGLMHHRSLFERHGRFDERFRFAGDFEFLLRELKHRDALFVPAVSVAMGHGGLTTRPENFSAMLAETRRAMGMHGLRHEPLRLVYWGTFAWAYRHLRALAGDRVARRMADLWRLVTLQAPRHSGRRARGGAGGADEKAAPR